MDTSVAQAVRRFEALVEGQLERVARLREAQPPTDFGALHPLVVGVAPGDGIGPVISRETVRVLQHLLEPEIAAGRIRFQDIEGLTIENRLRLRVAVPEDVLAAARACHVLLKGPTMTPEEGGSQANIESANVALRRELDLFANVRPVRVPSQGIDWMFFRENTEGPYALGSRGVRVGEDLALDFTVTTAQGSERIIRMAFEYARRNGHDLVLGVTKANVVKATDGLFLTVGERVSGDYPGIRWESWYADIVAAKLLDPKRRRDFHVFALPNLYGDILTDEAAEIQGGVGTAGSANLGTRHAMFEAIHGSGERMVREGRAEFADPSSLLRAAAMMLDHVGLPDRATALDRALDLCTQLDPQVVVTGRPTGATAQAFADHLLQTLESPDLESRWKGARDRVP